MKFFALITKSYLSRYDTKDDMSQYTQLSSAIRLDSFGSQEFLLLLFFKTSQSWLFKMLSEICLTYQIIIVFHIDKKSTEIKTESRYMIALTNNPEQSFQH